MKKIAKIAIEWAAKSAFDTCALIDRPSVKFSGLEARARAPFQHRLLAVGYTTVVLGSFFSTLRTNPPVGVGSAALVAASRRWVLHGSVS
jgi:hypothetical protein